MSEEFENEVPLSSKEARLKLQYIYYHQFHSRYRFRRNPKKSSPYLTNDPTFIYSVHRADWLEPVCQIAIPSFIFTILLGIFFANIWLAGKDYLGNWRVPLLVMLGILMLVGLVGIILGIVELISLCKARSNFVKAFLADERTSECRSRKKAAKWLWDFVAAHTMEGEAVLKYTYVPEWYDEYAYLLKWV